MISRALFVEAGHGARYDVLGGDQITFKATGSETDGVCTILETVVPPGVGPGAFLIAPPGVAHQFRNTTGGPGNLLITCHPAGFEKFVVEFAKLPVDQPSDPVQLAAIGKQFGIDFLPPML